MHRIRERTTSVDKILAKLAVVGGLINKLRDDAKNSTLTTTRTYKLLPHFSSAYYGKQYRLTDLSIERDAALEELKVYGRDPRYADPLFARDVSGT